MNWSDPTKARQFQSIVVTGLVLFLFGMPFAVQAQTVQTNQAELARETQPLVGPTPYPGAPPTEQAIASPNDTDLGEQQILKRKSEYQPFTISASVPVYYTSNVALTPSHELSDVVTAPVVGVYYQPRLTNNLSAVVDVRQQLFYYGKYHDFDFGSLDLEAGLTYILPEFHNLVLHGEYDFNRLTSSDRVLDEFFQNHTLILSAELPIRISRAQQLAIGSDVNLSLAADHQSPRRNDYEAYASYTVFLTRALSVNGVGRVVVRDYHQNDRTDVSEVFSFNANYQLTPWWAVSAIATFAHSDSNQDIFDYNVGNVGGAMGFTAKF